MNNSWFSHDSNARNSKKLIRLRQKHGAEGYGVYWMIIERLREEDNYTSDLDYDMIAFDLRVDPSLIKSVVEDFGLFEISTDGMSFSAHGLAERMVLRDARSASGKKGAKARWGEEKNPNEMAPDGTNDFCQMAKDDFAYSNKGKERKEKKENYSSSLSSSLPSEEEQQQEEFLFEMFSKNWASPQKELRRFVDFNNTGGRCWAKMSAEERRSAFNLWEQKPAKPPRFRSDELSLLKTLYSTLKERNAAYGLRLASLDDGVSFVRGDKIVKVKVGKELYDFLLENKRDYNDLFCEFKKQNGFTRLLLEPYGT